MARSLSHYKGYACIYERVLIEDSRSYRLSIYTPDRPFKEIHHVYLNCKEHEIQEQFENLVNIRFSRYRRKTIKAGFEGFSTLALS